MLSVGLVGLPNAGKSTLFNLLTKRSVPAENFPFCTIDPHDGVVEVPDERIDKLAEIVKAQKKVYSMIEFRDIAGLVKNASQGAGLGNQFLGHIQEVDMVLMVLRSFQNDDIIHVENRVNPIDDRDILMLELVLSDQNRMSKMLPKVQKDAKVDKLGTQKLEVFNSILQLLESGLPASNYQKKDLDKEVIKWRKGLNLLTDKPILYLSNIIQGGDNIKFESDFELDIKLEYDMQEMTKEDRLELGLGEYSGLDLMIRRCYQKLGLRSYLTAGEKEARSWTFRDGMTAPECAGVIHSDFEKKFIKAEVIKYNDFVELGGKKSCVENGKMALCGKDYVVHDGDVIEFKIGA